MKRDSFLLVVILVLAVALVFCFLNPCIAQAEDCKEGCSEQDLEKAGQSAMEEATAFFEKYAVALNDIHRANSYLEDLANVNLKGAEALLLQQIDYDSFKQKFDLGKEQVEAAEGYLAEAETILGEIGESAPNEFFEKERENRLEQAKKFWEIAESMDALLDNALEQIFEIEFGSRDRAQALSAEFNGELMGELNQELEEISVLNSGIDSAWEKDWYPVFDLWGAK